MFHMLGELLVGLGATAVGGLATISAGELIRGARLTPGRNAQEPPQTSRSSAPSTKPEQSVESVEGSWK